MLNFLFRRLTAEPRPGAELFEAATTIARGPHWYIEGKVPDTLDGRFAVLTTILALVLVRLEREGQAGDRLAVALTERFIEVMESEHREFGLGDPTLGRTVRKLVGSLARRNGLWRSAVRDEMEWPSAARVSLYKTGVSSHALSHCASALERLWARLEQSKVAEISRETLE
jgi:cytochrome b pre-mRNA-processing protein 3